jgi:hypothetical protein
MGFTNNFLVVVNGLWRYWGVIKNLGNYVGYCMKSLGRDWGEV